jgi:hypothetical protein
MRTFNGRRNGIAFAALVTGLLTIQGSYADSIVQYTVLGTTGDSRGGQFVVTNLDGLVTNNGTDADAGTTVSVSAAPYGTFVFN